MNSLVDDILEETISGSCIPNDVKIKMDYTKFIIIFIKIAFFFIGC